jgi:hypothetical protein
MQTEIEAEGLALDVRILGVNGVGEESENGLAIEGRDIPWLQDVPEQKVWESWEVTYRDVIILDEENVPVGVFNLTRNDLADTTHYNSLRSMLEGFADGR